MTLEEAIKRLEVASEGWPISDSENYYKALDLGREALRRIQELRGDGGYFGVPLLLGETKE